MYQLLNSAKHGIISTTSRDAIGYPDGNVVNIYVTAKNEIILFASNFANYIRNLRITERACITVLEYSGDVCEIVRGLNFYGRVNLMDKRSTSQIKKNYLKKFPRAEYYIKETSFEFYKLLPVKIKYFDKDNSLTIDFD